MTCRVDVWLTTRDPAHPKSLIGRSLLRTALSERFARHPSHWDFEASEKGKLSLASFPEANATDLSLSYSGNVVMAAISENCHIGVDIEELTTTSLTKSIEGVLTTKEMAWLDTVPEPLRRGEALKLWTAKEAYSKLVGLGNELDFRAVEVIFEPPRIEHGNNRVQLTTRKSKIGDASYWCSVATEEGANPDISFHF